MFFLWTVRLRVYSEIKRSVNEKYHPVMKLLAACNLTINPSLLFPFSTSGFYNRLSKFARDKARTNLTSYYEDKEYTYLFDLFCIGILRMVKRK